MAKFICIWESISKGPKEAPGHVKTPNGQAGIRPSQRRKEFEKNGLIKRQPLNAKL